MNRQRLNVPASVYCIIYLSVFFDLSEIKVSLNIPKNYIFIFVSQLLSRKDLFLLFFAIITSMKQIWEYFFLSFQFKFITSKLAYLYTFSCFCFSNQPQGYVEKAFSTAVFFFIKCLDQFCPGMYLTF